MLSISARLALRTGLARLPRVLAPSSLRDYHHKKPSYEDKILLLPDEVEYKYKDKRFLPGPLPSDEPYVPVTEEEMVDLTRVKLDGEASQDTVTKVDPNAEPFCHVLKGTEDGGKFTQVEQIPNVDEVWPWVERLMPKQFLDQPVRPDSVLIPPLPTTAPNLPYFVERTRTRLFPLYRRYKVDGRDKDTYWKNRWDGLINHWHQEILCRFDSIKWENNEVTITVTEVCRIRGDLWKFEEDARKYLCEQRAARAVAAGETPLAPDRDIILTSVNEVLGHVHFKGDFVQDLYKFLREKGF